MHLKVHNTMKIAPQTIVETKSYERDSAKIMSGDERTAAINLIAADPTVGDIIPGTGGIRKVRAALSGRGKRGGARIIYYYHDPDMPIFLLSIFAKSDRGNLSKAERNELAKLTRAIAQKYGR